MLGWKDLTLLTSSIVAINLSCVKKAGTYVMCAHRQTTYFPPHTNPYVFVFTLPPSSLVYMINKWWKIKEMGRLTLLKKLWRWEWVGILEYHRNLWCIFRISVYFPAVLFTMECCIIMFSLKGCRSYWKVKIVFLIFQNIRTDSFNLVKSLRNTCKWVLFFIKK